MSADSQKTAPRRLPREEVYKHIEQTEMDPSTAMRTLRNQLPWKDWLVVDFLRYWYILGVLALMTLLILQLAQMYHVNDLLGGTALVLLGAALAALGYIGYRVLWPQGGLTRLENLRRLLRRLGLRRRRFG